MRKLYPRVGKWLAQGHTQLGGGRGRIQTQAGPIARALSTASVPPLDMKLRLPGCMWTNFTALFTWMALWCCSSALVTPTTPFVLCLWSLISDSVKAPQGNFSLLPCSLRLIEMLKVNAAGPLYSWAWDAGLGPLPQRLSGGGACCFLHSGVSRKSGAPPLCRLAWGALAACP